MVLFNATGLLGGLFNSASTTFTGSLQATLIIVFILLLVVCFALQIPIEYISVVLIPFCIVAAAEDGKFFIPLVIFIMYSSAIIAKNFLFK